MTTQPAHSELPAITSPADVAASVPYLLGFQPANSIVMVFRNNHKSQLALTVRLDFPSPGRECTDEAAILSQINHCARTAIAAGADEVDVVGFPGRDTGARRALLARVCEVVSDWGVQLMSWGVVIDGQWTDFSDPDSRPVALDTAGVRAQVNWVGQGVSYVASREDLHASVVGDATALSLEVLGRIEPAFADRGLPPRTNSAARRRVEDSIVEFLSAAPEVGSLAVGEEPGSETLARWYLSLFDRRVREPILWRLATMDQLGDQPKAVVDWRGSALERLTWLVRNCPAQIGAPVSSVLAAFAWQCGSGALAMIAAENAVACDSRNILGSLVLQATRAGAQPGLWRATLASMTLGELRSSRRTSPSGSA